jgi:hypothetical protein
MNIRCGMLTVDLFAQLSSDSMYRSATEISSILQGFFVDSQERCFGHRLIRDTCRLGAFAQYRLIERGLLVPQDNLIFAGGNLLLPYIVQGFVTKESAVCNC